MKLKYLAIKDFCKTYYKYEGRIAPNCKLERYRGGFRISYRLPNYLKEQHYFGRIASTLSPRELQEYTVEFEALLRAGCFPTKVTDRLYGNNTKIVARRLTIDEAVNKYFGDYNTGKRQKSIKTVKEERTALQYLLTRYQSEYKLKYISDFTTEILVKINKDIELIKHKRTRDNISIATVKTYKKMIKAFLNCMIDYDHIESSACKTSKIIPLTYHNGKSDPQAYSRLVSIPQEVIEAVKKCSYKGRRYLPDIKSLFLFIAETGLRKSEALTLSTHNLYPNAEFFNEISIFDKEDCPTKDKIGFTVKSRNSVRKIRLSKASIAFIKSQLDIHAQDKIYGVIGPCNKEHTLVEYPFLFPKLDRVLKKWVRLDDFSKSLDSLIECAIKEADLKDCTQYVLHDLRRTVNLWLRGNGFTGEEAAYWLGHSIEVNETSYLSLRDKQELIHERNRISADKLFNPKKTE